MKKALLIIILLTFPTVVLADGWVLWSKVEHQGSVAWQIETAYPYFEICYAKAQALLKEDEVILSDAKSVGSIKDMKVSWSDMFILIYTNGGDISMRKYHCLPDSVDPRLK